MVCSNCVLKEADGVPINEWKVQIGSFNNKRISADVGQKITDNLYGRVNAVFEDSRDLSRFHQHAARRYQPDADRLPRRSQRSS